MASTQWGWRTRSQSSWSWWRMESEELLTSLASLTWRDQWLTVLSKARITKWQPPWKIKTCFAWTRRSYGSASRTRTERKSWEWWRLTSSSFQPTTWWTTRFWCASKRTLNTPCAFVNMAKIWTLLEIHLRYQEIAASPLLMMSCYVWSGLASWAAATSSCLLAVATSIILESSITCKTSTSIRRVRTSSSRLSWDMVLVFRPCIPRSTPIASFASCVTTWSRIRSKAWK